jgi:hypothetical protein
VRRAWRIVGTLVAVALLGLGTFQAVLALAHEEHTEVHRFAAAGVRVIDVHDATGHVRIVGSADEPGRIRVTAHVSDGLRATGHSERIEGDRLVLHASCPLFSNYCTVDYTVEAPEDVDVRVRTDSGTTVQGIRGDVDVDSEEGSVDLDRITGSIRAKTDQGHVRATGLRSSRVTADSDQGGVELRFLEAPRHVRATTDQGSVDVVLPDDGTSYQVSATTDQGTVERDIRSDPDSDHTITADSDQGDVVLRYP